MKDYRSQLDADRAQRLPLLRCMGPEMDLNFIVVVVWDGGLRTLASLMMSRLSSRIVRRQLPPLGILSLVEPRPPPQHLQVIACFLHMYLMIKAPDRDIDCNRILAVAPFARRSESIYIQREETSLHCERELQPAIA